MFLLGMWKNFAEMEERLTLEELQVILKAQRDREMRHWKFQASLKGIDLDGDEEETETGEEALARVSRRAGLLARGMTDEAEISRNVDKMELFDMGLDFVEGNEEIN